MKLLYLLQFWMTSITKTKKPSMIKLSHWKSFQIKNTCFFSPITKLKGTGVLGKIIKWLNFSHSYLGDLLHKNPLILFIWIYVSNKSFEFIDSSVILTYHSCVHGWRNLRYVILFCVRISLAAFIHMQTAKYCVPWQLCRLIWNLRLQNFHKLLISVSA